MKRRSTQPGIAAAVLGVAVVASMGAVLMPPATSPQVLASSERQPVTASTVDRKAVAQWLAGLSEVVDEPHAGVTHRIHPAALRASVRGLAGLHRVLAADQSMDQPHLPPPGAPVRAYLGDLSPPQV